LFGHKLDPIKQEFYFEKPMVIPFFTYILRCADGSYYTSSTDELDKRIAEHQNGEGCAWTRKRLPVEFVWRQEFPTRDEARAAEHQIKRWSRAKKEALIAGDFDLLKLLAGRSQLSRAALRGASLPQDKFDRIRYIPRSE
jgi:predicted GIY-YIG superfamily endonuclease